MAEFAERFGDPSPPQAKDYYTDYIDTGAVSVDDLHRFFAPKKATKKEPDVTVDDLHKFFTPNKVEEVPQPKPTTLQSEPSQQWENIKEFPQWLAEHSQGEGYLPFMGRKTAGFLRGAGDVGATTAQGIAWSTAKLAELLASHGMMNPKRLMEIKDWQSRVNEDIAARNEKYDPYDEGLGRFAGQIAATAPMLGGMGSAAGRGVSNLAAKLGAKGVTNTMAAGAAAGATAGAAEGALTSSASDEPLWLQTARGAGVGGMFGGAGGVARAGLMKMAQKAEKDGFSAEEWLSKHLKEIGIGTAVGVMGLTHPSWDDIQKDIMYGGTAYLAMKYGAKKGDQLLKMQSPHFWMERNAKGHFKPMTDEQRSNWQNAKIGLGKGRSGMFGSAAEGERERQPLRFTIHPLPENVR